MRISRISMPVALYGASIPARTFEMGDQAILNPIDFDGVVVNISHATENLESPHMEGADEFLAKRPNDLDGVNTTNRKAVGKSKTHFRARNLLYLRKR